MAHVPKEGEDMSSYTEGQTHQLMNRLEAEGFTADHITKLGQFGDLAGFKGVLDGTAKIKPVVEDATRVITLNETTIAVNLGSIANLPFNGTKVESHIGEGWAIVEKRINGLYVNGHKVIFHLSKHQQNNGKCKGYKLYEELAGKPVLNANLLDALADNPHLIPEDWKKDEDGNTLYIFFWATTYRSASGHLYVRYLFFNDDAGLRHHRWLDYDWRDDDPAALLAS